MADIFSKAQRSAIMSNIKSTNTQAELLAFRYLRRKGIYFQKHYGKVIGRPDIALPRKKKAVFIDGDFWHGRDVNRLSGKKYWENKILANIQRDKKVNQQLSGLGWTYLRVWESDIKRKATRDRSMQLIEEFLAE
ncbi:MAG: very short patch repair endonuclease [Chloroflexi bacterium]|nr:very short patch repair endonuclease [Chloroflexota bacterium]